MTENSKTTKRQNRLTPAQQGLLQQRVRAGLAGAAARGIQRRPDPSRSPLSFAQERFWLLQQLDPGSPVYNRPLAFRLEGALNLAALEGALSEVSRRHEVMRACFPSVQGSPVQIIHPPRPAHLAVVDLSAEPADQRQALAEALARQATRQPFDVSQGPLWRALLLRLGAEDHVLVLPMHHMISDAWSDTVLQHELSVLYPCLAQGQPSPLPELAVQVADYAAWQRQRLQGQALREDLAYWRDKLSHMPTDLSLPYDRLRPPEITHRGVDLYLRLPPPVVEGIRALSRQESATPFMTLLAALYTLLYRYTAAGDIAVGTAVAGRTQPETEGLIGCFINTLVLRATFSGELTFRQLLGLVRQVCLDAYAHQDLPFYRLVQALNPRRDSGRTPLFQVMFNSHVLSGARAPGQGLVMRRFEFDTGIAEFDLRVDIYQRGREMEGRFNFSADLFDHGTITRMMGHYRTLLEGVVANADRPIALLPILTSAEQQRIVLEWSHPPAHRRPRLSVEAGERVVDRQGTLHRLFEAQVERTPAATAIVCGEQSLTYRELNARANQLAHYLIERGAGPEVIIGMYNERSVETVVGLLGILKAGGAYLPLDADYPTGRLALMVQDARASLLLSVERMLERLGEPTVPAVCLDSDWPLIAAQSEENPHSEVSPENLAYVIYTSGSTGRPKGVMVPHRAICNFVHWMQGAFPLSSADRVLQRSSLSGDASLAELFVTLSTGAQLVLAPPGALDGGALVTCMTEGRVTLAQFVPALLQTLLDEGRLAACRDLTRVVSQGEALPVEVQEQLFAQLPVELYNLYGPTETTVYSTCWRCQPGVGQRYAPLGRPIANTQVYVLGQSLQPMPVGIPGELYIGGTGLARGYFNRPDATAASFIPHPFSEVPGARLYRTGDLGRWREDGTLEFLGRCDSQIKVRGFRVELGEVETVLRQHPLVRQAAVALGEGTPEQRALVAYVVPSRRPDDPVRTNVPNELRGFLRERLPDYMIPADFVLLDAFPLTPNGKLDRRALPRPDRARPELESRFAAPRNPMEELLGDIFGQLLRRDGVGIHDDFFELGGHSLLAMQVVSRLRQMLGIDLSVRALFDAPTVAGLASAIVSMRQSARSPGSPTLTAHPRRAAGEDALRTAATVTDDGRSTAGEEG